MKYYIDTGPDSREYIASVARTRPELANEQRGMSVEIDGKLYHVNGVKAEPGQSVLDIGLLAAGLSIVGIIIGNLLMTISPLLAILLAVAGPVAGIGLALKRQENEERQALFFNSSRIYVEPDIEYAQAA
jgi:hypothetical protein